MGVEGGPVDIGSTAARSQHGLRLRDLHLVNKIIRVSKPRRMAAVPSKGGGQKSSVGPMPAPCRTLAVQYVIEKKDWEQIQQQGRKSWS